MTDNTRALLEQALNALTYKGHFPWADKEHFIDALRAELAKPRLDQAETNKRLQALADSEGTRAVEYLRRARKAESEIERLRAELAKQEQEESFIPDWANYRQGVADGKAGSPKWRDEPTEPGLWVRNGDDCVGVYSISEAAIKILKGSAARWYGPICEDAAMKGTP